MAGIIADAQQGQHTVFGFTDPVLYRLAGTSAFHDMLPSTSATPAQFRGVVCNVAFCGAPALITFDDQNPAMPGYTGQVTVKGYDNMTGLGTPNGQQFLKALRKHGGLRPAARSAPNPARTAQPAISRRTSAQAGGLAHRTPNRS